MGPLGPKMGHTKNCHEQFLFYTYKGIYTQYALTVLLLDLEKKIFEIYTNLGIMGPPPGPPWGPHVPFEQNWIP